MTTNFDYNIQLATNGQRICLSYDYLMTGVITGIELDKRLTPFNNKNINIYRILIEWDNGTTGSVLPRILKTIK